MEKKIERYASFFRNISHFVFIQFFRYFTKVLYNVISLFLCAVIKFVLLKNISFLLLKIPQKRENRQKKRKIPGLWQHCCQVYITKTQTEITKDESTISRCLLVNVLRVYVYLFISLSLFDSAITRAFNVFLSCPPTCLPEITTELLW